MANKRSQAQPDEKTELLKPISEARASIDARIQLGREIIALPIADGQQLDGAKARYLKWTEYNSQLLRSLFTGTQFLREYEFWGAMSIPMNPTLGERIEDLRKDVTDKIRRLESLSEKLELVPLAASVRQEPVEGDGPSPKTNTTRAFVVHGHDDAARESVARFLEKHGITAVILHEQASMGKSIIEKLEHYSDVGFAIILLTPDDLGRKNELGSIERPRARQNVILELGYFIAHLGRAHVCALHRGDVEIPSDYMGVVYVTLDPAGAWKFALGKEMRAVGFNIDLNKV